MPLDTVRDRLKRTSYGFLSSIEFEKKNLNEALKLGREALYYLYLILMDQQREEEAVKALELLVKAGRPFWKAHALELMLEHLLEKKQYGQAESICLENFKILSGSHGGEINTQNLKRLFLESLYWQQKSAAVLSRLDELYSKDTIDGDAELSLFRAVSACRSDLPGWTDLFEKLFLVHQASSIHARAFKFLIDDPQKFSRFPPIWQNLLEGKYQLSDGEYPKAVDLLEQALAGFSAKDLEGSSVIKETGFAYLHAQSYSRGIRLFESLESRLTGRERLEAIEMKGRILRRTGLREDGIKSLRIVERETQDPLQRDRCLWFILNMSYATSKEEGLNEVEKSASLWSDPGYFDDLMDAALTDYTLEGDDNSLIRLYQAAREAVSPYVLRRLTTILTLKGHGSSKSVPPSESPKSSTSSTAATSSIASASSIASTSSTIDSEGSLNAVFADLYYEFLLSTLEGRRPPSLITAAEADSAKEGESKKVEAATDSLDNLILGLMDYGLYERGYESVMRNLSLISRQTQREAAERLESMGFYTEGMRIMNSYLAEMEGSPDEWRLAFPLAYGVRIEELAGEAAIPKYLLFALVREESYFDPSSGSRAGAVGLMQIMPETAEEEAGELGLEDFDLEDPEDNLRIGVKYLKKLRRKLGSWVRALMAYNAGPTKVRRWIRQHGDMPDELRVESFPFPETRHFVRKILVSTVLYTLLYAEEGKTGEVVRLFFPSLEEYPNIVD
jgi:soluble lytic murein transglycosylase